MQDPADACAGKSLSQGRQTAILREPALFHAHFQIETSNLGLNWPGADATLVAWRPGAGAGQGPNGKFGLHGLDARR